MSRFFSKKFASLTPYTPGEQPKDTQYVKLNTNEMPFPPSEKALKYARENTRSLNLYSDPDCSELRAALAEMYHVDADEVIVTNGSDEILNFAFMAFCDDEHPAVFPNISYGFYPVFAELNGIPYVELPLCDDFSIDIGDIFTCRIDNDGVVLHKVYAKTRLSDGRTKFTMTPSYYGIMPTRFCYWIEGIGDITDGTFMYIEDSFNNLSSCEENNKTIYPQNEIY